MSGRADRGYSEQFLPVFLNSSSSCASYQLLFSPTSFFLRNDSAAHRATWAHQNSSSHLSQLSYLSSPSPCISLFFHYYHEICEAGLLYEQKGLFTSQFWRFKGLYLVMAFLLADSCGGIQHHRARNSMGTRISLLFALFL
jgi:hypothetical protein